MADASELLHRVTVEVGPEEDINDVEGKFSEMSAYVGYEPSGLLHLGHLITAQKLCDLQRAGVDVTVLMADVHAHINGKGDLDEIRETGEEMWEQLCAFGIDGDDATLTFGSSFQYDVSYQKKLHELEDNVSLNRAQRAMAEIAGDETPTVGHVVYPLMQALDIHALDVDIAVGGMEQRKVHMLARDALPTIGATPPVYVHTPLVADLETGDGKMSSSEGTTLSAADTHSEVNAKVADAFCPPARTQEGLENPVLQLYEYLVFPRTDTVTIPRSEEYGGDISFSSYAALEAAVEDGTLHPQDAKDTLATHINRILDPIRNQHEGN